MSVAEVGGYIGIATVVLSVVLIILRAIPGDQKEGLLQRILEVLKGKR